jgi:hypothetical protein
MEVRTISSAPVIDGQLTDECWKEAAMDSGFTQVSPFPDRRAAKTVVRMMRDSKRLFVSFYCRKQPGQRPTTTLLKEDALGMNDQVMVILDTFRDRRTGYLFASNPLNVKTEAKISRDGNVVDTQWDEYWSCATVVTDTSWTAEFAIPFDILHFKKLKDIWNVNFVRVDCGNAPEPEWSVWSHTGANPYRISRCGKLVFMEGVKTGGPLNVIPYGTLTEEEKKVGGDIERHFPTLMDVGFSLYTDPKYYDVNHTRVFINPSTDEIPDIPEERRIMIADAPLFSSPYPLVNTRRIDSVKYAWRIGGKAGEYDAGYLKAQTQSPERNHSFLAVQRGFRQGSSISWYDLRVDTNEVMSVQADFSFDHEIRPKFQYSWNPEEKAPALFYGEISRQTPTLSMNLGYTHISSRFAADMGELPVYGRNYWIDGTYDLRINRFLYKLTPSFSYDKNQTGAELSLLLKNRIGAGAGHDWEEDGESSTCFIAYNENEWAPSVRIAYSVETEEVCLYSRLSFLSRISSDFRVSYIETDSIDADIGITVRLTDKITSRIFAQELDQRNIATTMVIKYQYMPDGCFHLAYGEERDLESDYVRTDYVLQAKLTYIFRIPGEKLLTLGF